MSFEEFKEYVSKFREEHGEEKLLDLLLQAYSEQCLLLHESDDYTLKRDHISVLLDEIDKYTDSKCIDPLLDSLFSLKDLWYASCSGLPYMQALDMLAKYDDERIPTLVYAQPQDDQGRRCRPTHLALCESRARRRRSPGISG